MVTGCLSDAVRICGGARESCAKLDWLVERTGFEPPRAFDFAVVQRGVNPSGATRLFSLRGRLRHGPQAPHFALAAGLGLVPVFGEAPGEMVPQRRLIIGLTPDGAVVQVV